MLTRVSLIYFYFYIKILSIFSLSYGDIKNVIPILKYRSLKPYKFG